MADMNIPSPHTKSNPACLRCKDGALKYNHCAVCGDDFQSHEALKDHWRNTECGPWLVAWLEDRIPA